ncbi:two-component regulator propeller domain-containing protein [Archangium sp.]|uniref:two-component regulator propeller domain-containing protein n=1 Tax=Archangium sp. TaxID=1872627 RepID=UPI002D50FEF3|nr:two-component regulator propeller domain-containing protein [Archangium sp.]HYO55426.1 two-component regulator propeller domain-containing protein [Archangium sp.]
MRSMSGSPKEASSRLVILRHRARSLAALLLVGLFASGGSASALEPDKAPRQFPHRAWQTADGLPQNSVLSLVQTPEGYLWGGTWEGLVRFDGARFTVFDRTNTPALPGRTIRSLAVGQDGTLWIGTDKGLASMREGTFLPVVPPAGTVLSNLQELLVTRDGSLWIATDGHGLTRLSQGRFRTWKKANGLASDEPLALAEDEAGGLWVGSTGGLQRWNGTAWTAPLPFEGGHQVAVRALAMDGEGTLWAGTEKGEVYRLQEGVPRRVPEASPPAAPVSAMLVDREGGVWVGSLGQGVRRVAGGRVSELEAGHALAGSVVSDLLEDVEGNLWIGTEGRGLHRLEDAPFTTYGPPEGLAHEMVLAIHEARDGSLWFSTVGGGVSRWRDGRMTSWNTSHGLILDRVRAIAESPDGSLWFGTREGISRWSAGTFTSFGAGQGLGDPRAYVLAVDADGTLWAGTPTGLFRRSGERFEPFTPRGGLPGQDITLLRPSAAGGLWVGTKNGGLAHLLDGQATVLTPENGPLDGKVLALHEETDGTLWIGTREGVFRWKAGRFRRFSSADGLFDERAFQILSDGRGHLWMSGNKGVFRVPLAELEAVAEGRRARVTSRAYGTEDGMRSQECNALGAPAGLRARDGRLWFPTIRGAVAYTPEHEQKRTPPPPVLIEELRVDGRPVPRSEWGRIPAGDGRIEFQYTAAGLRAPQRLRFRYQLEGFDADWVEAGAQRVASYTRLGPGHYRFRVEAEYADGGGAAPGVEVALYLRPRLHQTLPFRAACVLAAVLAVAGGVWLRLRRSRQRERELQAHVDQRTAELATLNADLKARLQELQATRERLVHAEKMAAVGTLAAGVGHELNNPLAFVVSNLHYVASEVREVVPRGEERERWGEVEQALVEALQGTERMRRIIQDLKTFSRVQPERHQRVEVHAVLELALSIAAAEMRHRARVVKDYGLVSAVLGDETRLGQVFLNLLVNAAQAIPVGHAGQHEIRITTRQDERGQVVVAVSDTGVGIPPEVLSRIFEPFFTTKPVGVGTGLGLSICHSYVQAMGGDIRVRSEVGRGTTFEVVLRSALEDPPAVRAERSTASQGKGSRGRLMVIDDEPLLLAALSRTLAPEHEVVAFTGARQALERLRVGERYSLILCDVMMPEMTGLELYETLVREVPGQAERMVFLTGGAFTGAARAFLETTRRPCLDKPFEPEVLRARIHVLLVEHESTASAA